MKRLNVLLVAIILLGTSACAPMMGPRVDQYKFEKPRVAILEFDNKASLSSQWKLSEGMRDMLVDALVKTDRYTVLTRKDLGAVISELDIQSDPRFRDEGKLAQGKLKNVQYLIKGSVTDFTPDASGGALRVLGGKLFGIGGSGSVAMVSVTIYVIDVESGEIIASKTMEGSAASGTAEVGAEYRNIAIGGRAFFRTPLGRATQDVIDQALANISEAVATNQWYPAIIKIDDVQVYMSGGEDRHIKIGSKWATYIDGEELVDPTTGDVLGREPGQLVGELLVTNVYEKYSIAKVLKGVFSEGQTLRLILEPKKK